MFWALHQCICLLCMWLHVCCVSEVTLLLLQHRAMAAAAGRQAGNDEVIQQAGLRPWQLALRPVPVLTGAVVQWARCYGPCSTTALPHCCFFISLVLDQVAARLARPTAWTHSCCRALGPSHSVSLSPRLCLWSHTVTAVLTGNKGSGYVPTHSLTQLCKPLTLWCVAIRPGLLKGQMPSDHSRALLPHASATVDERWTKWTGEGQEKDHLYPERVERQGQTWKISKWMKAFYWSSNVSLTFGGCENRK